MSLCHFESKLQIIAVYMRPYVVHGHVTRDPGLDNINGGQRRELSMPGCKCYAEGAELPERSLTLRSASWTDGKTLSVSKKSAT